MIQQEVKNKIRNAIVTQRAKFQSDGRMALYLGVTTTMYSRLVNMSDMVGDSAWMTVARQLEVEIRGVDEWKTVETPVYQYIYAQLTLCQEKSMSGLLCDAADVGKTHTAKAHVRTHGNAVYIDCSQVKTKRDFIRAIAKGFGVEAAHTYSDMYANLICYLQSAKSPLVIVDEAGDLEYPAFLELKALWNATDGCCGWYMMGADGLKAKIERSLESRKVGYAELFSRFGSRYQKITPDGGEALDQFKQHQIAVIAKANSGDVDVKKLIAKVGGSLRRVKLELRK